MFTVYNSDGSKRTEWKAKTAAVAAAKTLNIPGVYVVNEKTAEIIYTAR